MKYSGDQKGIDKKASNLGSLSVTETEMSWPLFPSQNISGSVFDHLLI